MGIDGLWKVADRYACCCHNLHLTQELQAIEEKISLHNLAVGTGFIANVTGARGFSLGIDASGWMYRACYLHGNTESPELVALFARCSRLFRLLYIPIFVFDGPNRPAMKRGKVIRGNDHWLTGPFQQMLDGFGFAWIMVSLLSLAPGEAEATLSEMTTNGIPLRVDAILTDDSDSFVFGASVVLRMYTDLEHSRTEDNDNFEASRYSAYDITTVLGLSRESLILIAILAGGDYSDRLRNCGLAIAMGLARAGLGQQLISGLHGLSHAGSVAFLQTWRESLRLELETNGSGYLPHRCKQLASQVPADFPNLNVINLYLHPIVSSGAAARSLVFQAPRLDILAQFAEAYFGWGDSIGILMHFADQLFAGLVVRELTQRALVNDGILLAENPPSIIKRIVGSRRHKSTGHLVELRVLLNLASTMILAPLQTITGRRDPSQGAEAAVTEWITKTLPKTRVWVPRSMVEHVYPVMVLDYICAQGMLVSVSVVPS
ncbi:PIN domain-like protein [Mycena belliarum]|uniref:PIN domain-like protein n=1 Tax=Mycena belliarum TaxID=1033014 RepID=A0AAD6XUX5_9AGAR|nr:PIN domain-like protein [Mycena belliae]